jgi:Ni,Fe-hydrogenase I large subunit
VAKVVLDPVTRIEGHLGIEVSAVPAHPTVSGAGFPLQVKTAHLSSHMYRGFENILKGRKPSDAIQITQRI